MMFQQPFPTPTGPIGQAPASLFAQYANGMNGVGSNANQLLALQQRLAAVPGQNNPFAARMGGGAPSFPTGGSGQTGNGGNPSGMDFLTALLGWFRR